MKFLKGMFPSGKKTAGTVVMVIAGVLIYSVINRKYNIESKVSQALPDAGANMKKAV